jgi:hypothetical protein
MKSRAPATIRTALVLLMVCQSLAAFAQGENAPAGTPPANSENIPAKNEASPANEAGPVNEASPEKTEAAPAKTEAPNQASPAKVEPAPTQLSCRAVRNDIGMYEPLRFMTITIDLPKKYVKMVHEGDGRVFEYRDGGPKNFVRITDDTVIYGQQGRETWRIDRYTGTLTSTAFTIQFECQLRPAERKF